MGIAAYNRGTMVIRRQLAAKESRYDRALGKIAFALERGAILRAYNALDREETTAGPYQQAVDCGYRFAVIGWRGNRPQREHQSARSAAMDFISRVGIGRALETVR